MTHNTLVRGLLYIGFSFPFMEQRAMAAETWLRPATVLYHV
jgi:hypothetical protein